MILISQHGNLKFIFKQLFLEDTLHICIVSSHLRDTFKVTTRAMMTTEHMLCLTSLADSPLHSVLIYLFMLTTGLIDTCPPFFDKNCVIPRENNLGNLTTIHTHLVHIYFHYAIIRS